MPMQITIDLSIVSKLNVVVLTVSSFAHDQFLGPLDIGKKLLSMLMQITIDLCIVSKFNVGVLTVPSFAHGQFLGPLDIGKKLQSVLMQITFDLCIVSKFNVVVLTVPSFAHGQFLGPVDIGKELQSVLMQITIDLCIVSKLYVVVLTVASFAHGQFLGPVDIGKKLQSLLMQITFDLCIASKLNVVVLTVLSFATVDLKVGCMCQWYMDAIPVKIYMNICAACTGLMHPMRPEDPLRARLQVLVPCRSSVDEVVCEGGNALLLLWDSGWHLRVRSHKGLVETSSHVKVERMDTLFALAVVDLGVYRCPMDL